MAEYLSHQKSEYGNPDSWILEKVDWDAFCTFTWADVPPLSVQEKCMLELIRRVAKQVYRVPRIVDYYWALRYEIGEKTGRPHWHAVMGAYRNPPTTNKTIISNQIEHIWEKEVKQFRNKRVKSHGWEYQDKVYRPCVGFAKVRPYDSSMAGAEYVCKPALSARDYYELEKFHDGFKREEDSDATRVSLGPLVVLEIAKTKNRRPHKVHGYARFLRGWKQRNLNPKRVSNDKRRYGILPNQVGLHHPGDDPTLRGYC